MWGVDACPSVPFFSPLRRPVCPTPPLVPHASLSWEAAAVRVGGGVEGGAAGVEKRERE